MLSMPVKILANDILKYFPYFFPKMDFDISFTICLKCQSPFSRKKNLINLLFDEFAQSVKKIKALFKIIL